MAVPSAFVLPSVGRAIRIAIAIAAVDAFSPALAQAPASMQGDLQASFAAAQEASIRPGDEALGCDALERELVVVAKDPALQAHVSKSGADAQRKIDAMNAAASGAMAGQAATTLISSIVPGGAWIGHSAAVAQAEGQRAQAEVNVQSTVQRAREMMTLMPQLLRGQRVIELAQARDCAWVRDAMRR